MRIGSLLILALAACKSAPEEQVKEYDGVWEVAAAERNGRPTELVVGGVFEFEEEQQLFTDWTGTDQHGQYQVADNVIIHHAPLELTYEVVRYLVDTMILQVQLERMHFALQLIRLDESAH